jgi:hypothetical protein
VWQSNKFSASTKRDIHTLTNRIKYITLCGAPHFQLQHKFKDTEHYCQHHFLYTMTVTKISSHSNSYIRGYLIWHIISIFLAAVLT